MKCNKCEGTGFAYGKIPCECTDTKHRLRNVAFRLDETGRILKEMVNSIERLALQVQQFSILWLTFDAIANGSRTDLNGEVGTYDDECIPDLSDAIERADFYIQNFDFNRDRKAQVIRFTREL